MQECLCYTESTTRLPSALLLPYLPLALRRSAFPSAQIEWSSLSGNANRFACFLFFFGRPPSHNGTIIDCIHVNFSYPHSEAGFHPKYLFKLSFMKLPPRPYSVSQIIFSSFTTHLLSCFVYYFLK